MKDNLLKNDHLAKEILERLRGFTKKVVRKPITNGFNALSQEHY